MCTFRQNEMGLQERKGEHYRYKCSNLNLEIMLHRMRCDQDRTPRLPLHVELRRWSPVRAYDMVNGINFHVHTREVLVPEMTYSLISSGIAWSKACREVTLNVSVCISAALTAGALNSQRL